LISELSKKQQDRSSFSRNLSGTVIVAYDFILFFAGESSYWSKRL